jgi:hypothetical protein
MGAVRKRAQPDREVGVSVRILSDRSEAMWQLGKRSRDLDKNMVSAVHGGERHADVSGNEWLDFVEARGPRNERADGRTGTFVELVEATVVD